MSPKKKTWKVLEEGWVGDADWLFLNCPRCGYDAAMPTRGKGPLVIASIGLRLILDPPGAVPPEDWLPNLVQCRNCRRIFGSGPEQEGVPSVR